MQILRWLLPFHNDFISVRGELSGKSILSYRSLSSVSTWMEILRGIIGLFVVRVRDAQLILLRPALLGCCVTCGRCLCAGVAYVQALFCCLFIWVATQRPFS